MFPATIPKANPWTFLELEKHTQVTSNAIFPTKVPRSKHASDILHKPPCKASPETCPKDIPKTNLLGHYPGNAQTQSTRRTPPQTRRKGIPHRQSPEPQRHAARTDNPRGTSPEGMPYGQTTRTPRNTSPERHHPKQLQ